ncbi:hypothetical protein HK405_000183 [Cladochytrium tenue]|nr:hypothetical protein HK405_000183 [Cladochytrium tenue]
MVDTLPSELATLALDLAVLTTNVALLRQGDPEDTISPEARPNAIARIASASRSDATEAAPPGHRALVRSSVLVGAHPLHTPELLERVLLHLYVAQQLDGLVLSVNRKWHAIGARLLWRRLHFYSGTGDSLVRLARGGFLDAGDVATAWRAGALEVRAAAFDGNLCRSAARLATDADTFLRRWRRARVDQVVCLDPGAAASSAAAAVRVALAQAPAAAAQHSRAALRHGLGFAVEVAREVGLRALGGFTCKMTSASSGAVNSSGGAIPPTVSHGESAPKNDPHSAQGGNNATSGNVVDDANSVAADTVYPGSLIGAVERCISRAGLRDLFAWEGAGGVLQAAPVSQPRHNSAGFVRELRLDGLWAVTDAVVAALVTGLPALTDLYLVNCLNVTDKTVEAAARECRRLRRIFVHGCPRAGARAPASLKKYLPYCLREWDVPTCSVFMSSKDVQKLVSACTCLEVLSLGHSLWAGGRIKTFNIFTNSYIISDDALGARVMPSRWAAPHSAPDETSLALQHSVSLLLRVELGGAGITDGGLEALTEFRTNSDWRKRMPVLIGVRHLGLAGCPISEAGLRALADRCTELETLDIRVSHA